MFEHTSRRRVLASTGLLAAGTLIGPVEGAGAAQAELPLRWTETYDRNGYDTARDAVADDGAVTLAGYTNDGDDRPWAFSVGPEGERRWGTALDVDEPTRVRGVASAGEGALLAGTHSEGQEGGTVTLFRVDGEGERQWTRTYDTPGDSPRTYDVAAVGDGYVVCGVALTSRQLVAWALRVDEEGERQWLTELSEHRITYAFGVRPAVDGGALLMGTVRPEPTRSESDPPYDGYVTKLDGEGEREWAERYSARTTGGSGQVQLVYDAASTGDGYVLAGYVAPSFDGSAGRGWALTTDESGGRGNSFLYQPGEDGTARFFAVAPTEDGFALAGVAQEGETAADSMLVLGVETGSPPYLRIRPSTSSAPRTLVWPPTTNPPSPAGTAAKPTSTATSTPTSTGTLPLTMETDAAAGSTLARTDTTSGTGPGFGAVGALAALGAGALSRRLRSRDG
ncbi:hypothetical protein BRC67_12510 [Halobacteriales archaeon QH_3_68_24]|nr:MAG: hypothetical protein BRC67_12510 [Halobacteriales archaeon QH_3_68_24]